MSSNPLALEVPDITSFIVFDSIFVRLSIVSLFNLKHHICMAGDISHFTPITFVSVVKINFNLQLQKIVVNVRRVFIHSYISYQF
jgi:hypothetical protein